MFIVGRLAAPESTEWELMGIFSTEEKAVAACKHPCDYIAGPLKMDELLPDEVVIMLIHYFPNPPDGYDKYPAKPP